MTLNDTQNLYGWCTLDKATRLYELVEETNRIFPENILASVEIGVFGGRSFIPMAMAHKAINRGVIYGFDSYDLKDICENMSPDNRQWWEGQNLKMIYKSVMDAIFDYDVGNYCELMRLNSETSNKLVENNSVTLLHLDGNHDSKVILKDLEIWTPKIKKQGFLICDDTDWKEAQEGYSRVPDYGFTRVEDYKSWQVFQKK